MAKQQLNPLKPATGGETNPDLQALLGQQGTGEQENNDGGSAGEQKPNPTPKPQAPQQPKAPEKQGNGLVTFYTRIGMPFDPKTGKERPCRKHVVTRTWWLVNKDKLTRLGYTVVKVEGE